VKRPWFTAIVYSDAFLPPELMAYQGRAVVFDADVFLRVFFLFACFPGLTGSMIAQIERAVLNRSACLPGCCLPARKRLSDRCLEQIQ